MTIFYYCILKNDCFWKKRSFLKKILSIMLTIVNEGSWLTIVKERLSSKIVNETTKFIKRVVFGKAIVFEKNDMQLYLMLSYLKLKSCGAANMFWYFLKSYSMISTDAHQVGFLSSSMIVNEGSSLTIVNKGSSLTIVNKGAALTIVNETKNFIKTIVLKIEKRTF